MVGVSSEYRLELHTTRGDTLQIASSWPPVPLSDREREAAREQIVERSSNLDEPVSIEVPEVKPPLADAWFDRPGRLWVELSVEDGADRRADVWNDAGELLGHVVWPAEISLNSTSWIGDDVIVGLRRDELGVDYLVVLTPPEVF